MTTTFGWLKKGRCRQLVSPNTVFQVRVKVDTMDGTADEGDDYIAMHEIVTFEPGQKEMDIELEIVDDDDWEPDEEFYFKVCLLATHKSFRT